jgi:hypothetical protein
MLPDTMFSSWTLTVRVGWFSGTGVSPPESTMAAPRKISSGVIVSCSPHLS